MEHKAWRKDKKTIKYYTIALKFRDEFNANFVLLYYSSYSSKKMWHFFLKNVEKNNNTVHLRFVLTYPFFSKTFSILRDIFPWHSKKIVHLLFCVFQTKLNKAVNISCRLPIWVKNVQMIPGYSKINLDENLVWLTQKTEDPKSNKANLIFPHSQ